MASAKKTTKKDLEDKIAELEAKLSQLSEQISRQAKTKPTKAKPAEAKPKEAPKPAKRPAATTKPKRTMSKGMEQQQQAEAPKEKETPKPAEIDAPPPSPATMQEALENAYYGAPETSFHDYRAKVTGYSPAPNRYFVRRTAPVGKVPTTNWNEQKSKVTGYTQPSNQYFATRARLAYHPPDKTFGGFSGTGMSVEGVATQAEETLTLEPPKPKRGTLSKEF